MKATGKRITQLIDSVLGMSREEFCRATNVSRTSVLAIENGTGGKRSLEEIIDVLQLNPVWVHEGKGSMWKSGIDRENIDRIRSIKARGLQVQSDSESFIEIKKELDRYRDREDRLQRIIDKLLSGGTNFRKALGNASYAKTA